jgi:pyruvate/2-oxoglutarate/acetoin dehydrogenase E1 component
MKRYDYLQIRLEPEIKERVKAKGDMSAYVRGLILKDLGLSNGGAGLTESQPKGQGLGGATAGSVPVAESQSQIYAALKADELTKLIKQIEAQGKSSSEAQALARKRLGLLGL